MVPLRFVWLAWCGSFLLIRAILLFAFPRLRWAQVIGSVFALPFATAEVLFYGVCWAPPTIFRLGERFHVDLESFVFCFAVGGIAAVLYHAVGGTAPQIQAPRLLPRPWIAEEVLLVPFVCYPIFLIASSQPLPSGIGAPLLGSAARCMLLPAMGKQTMGGGLLFALFTIALFGVLDVLAPPGYVARVWSAKAGPRILVGVRQMEVVFAFALGLYWSGFPEQSLWTLNARS